VQAVMQTPLTQSAAPRGGKYLTFSLANEDTGWRF
jgi:hypothetical protein